MALETYRRKRDFSATSEPSGEKPALAEGDSKSEFVVYPDSGHAFHADYRPSYVAADAKDGWKRCLAWFRKHGV